jgi:tetratricopeptide (TPR) repeat protein
LGILVGKDFGEELAGVVHESDSSVVEGLERLIDAQLLEVDADLRYHFHDLICLFSREKSGVDNSSEKQKEIKNRIIDWGYGKSSVMNYFLRPGEIHQRGFELIKKDSDPPAIEWFEQEYENLLKIINLAEEMKRLDIIAPFVANLIFFFEAKNHLTDWKKSCESAVQAACQIGDVKEESQSLVALGLMYIRRCQWDKAINCYKKSLDIQRKAGDLHGQSQSLNNFGIIYQRQGKWDKAIDCCLEDLDICEKMGDLYGKSKSIHNLGNIYNTLNQWDDAIDCYLQSLNIKRGLGDRNGEGGTLNNLGLIYQTIGQCNEAINFYNQGIAIFQELRDTWRESMCLNNLGLSYQHQHQWSKSVECHQKALKMQEKLDDKHGVSTSLSSLAVTYQFQGLLDDALECHHRNLSIFQELGNQSGASGAAQALRDIGMLHHCKNQLDKAAAYYNDSLYAFRELGDSYEEGKVMLGLGCLYATENLYDKAIECYQSSLVIFRDFDDIYSEGQVLANIGSLHKQQGRNHVATTFWEDSLSRLPENSIEYQMVKEWLENNSILSRKTIFLAMLSVVILLGGLILGQFVVKLITFCFVVTFWLIIYLKKNNDDQHSSISFFPQPIFIPTG